MTFVLAWYKAKEVQVWSVKVGEEGGIGGRCVFRFWRWGFHLCDVVRWLLLPLPHIDFRFYFTSSPNGKTLLLASSVYICVKFVSVCWPFVYFFPFFFNCGIVIRGGRLSAHFQCLWVVSIELYWKTLLFWLMLLSFLEQVCVCVRVRTRACMCVFSNPVWFSFFF